MTDKKTCERLINKLATRGRKVEPVRRKAYKPKRPVMIGDCLAKVKDNIEAIADKDFIYGSGTTVLELIRLWELCGFTKSLNEIVEESGFEEVKCYTCKGCGSQDCACYCGAVCVEGGAKKHNTECLKDPNARSLAEFLIDIFLTSQT